MEEILESKPKTAKKIKIYPGMEAKHHRPENCSHSS
jgi:hypothetical protein